MLSRAVIKHILLAEKQNRQYNLKAHSGGQSVELLLIGKTGHGKSATGNTILGLSPRDTGFKSSGRSSSVTTHCERKQYNVRGRDVAVVDTPGTMDTKNPSATLEEIATAVVKCPNGFSAFLIVIRFGTRMTEEEINAIECLKVLFGPQLGAYSIIVVTQGDQWEHAKEEEEEASSYSSYQKYIRDHGNFGDLLDFAQGRCILIENSNPSKKPHYSKLILEAVDNVLAYNRGFRYSNKYFEQAREMQSKKIVEQERIRRLKAEMEKDAGCFPADAVVIVDDLRKIKMEDLHVGQNVLTGFDNGKETFSEVYMFGHAQQNAITTFYSIETDDKSLTLSPDHHVFITDSGSIITKAAKDVNIGDIVLTLNRDESSLCQGLVLKISTTEKRGLFAPFTMDGSIIVNGVLTSCYIDMVPPPIAHPLMWPVRQLYKVSPTALATISKNGDDGIPRWIGLFMDNMLS